MRVAAFAGIVSAAILSAGCVRSSFTEADFLVSEGISLYVKGKQIMTYTPEKCQIGFSPESREIRVSDDNMADYFIVRFNGDAPANEGEEMEADLEYTTSDDLRKQRGVCFRVTRTDEDSGLVWLWNEAGKTGIVLPDTRRLY